ncbi:MAG: hypothetical protein WBI27_04260 [Thermoanaerobaculia bacterium]
MSLLSCNAFRESYGWQTFKGSVYRTLEGGDTWERILFVDENTGASDLVMDPNNPRILFAGMWERDRVFLSAQPIVSRWSSGRTAISPL